MLTRTKLRNFRLDVEGAFDFNTENNISKSLMSPLMLLILKNDMEDLLKNMDCNKMSSFQPPVFSGQSIESDQDFINDFENYSKFSG